MEAQHDGDMTTYVACVEEADSLKMLVSKLSNRLEGGSLRDGINSEWVNNSEEA